MKRGFYVLGFLLLSLCIFTGIRVLATDNGGKVLVDKSSVKDDFTYGRSALVNLEVKGIEYSKYNNIEIVFVLDRSSSMDNNNKMQAVKDSVSNIISNLLPNDNINIGIVTFGTDVLDSYTTSKLTNDKDKLINLINVISNDSYEISMSGLATNISSALEKANSLFSLEEGSKTIMLLTDGKATKFNYNNKTYGSGFDDTSYCVEWKKYGCSLRYSPTEYAKKISDDIRKNGISIYSVGFDVEEEDLNFLSSISDKYYSSENNEEDLINNFNHALENIMVIGKDIIITDNVPNYFTIDKEKILTDYPSSLIIDNPDGTSTIKFKLDSLNALYTYNFSYEVYAKDDYYGYMYTNSYAIIEGVSLIDGAYEESKIYEVFPKPIVEIPCITNDDKYNVTLGKELNVGSGDGILKNDKLNLINETDAKIKNNIIVNNTSSSCGDLVVNDDGSFKYVPIFSCLGKEVEFDYYVETKIYDNVVKSNTSSIKINVEKDNINIINPKVFKSGTVSVEKVNSLVEYKINYNTVIDNYLGNANITIIDNLPCEIDETESLLDGAIYDKEKLTLTWNINLDDINTYDYGKKIIDINKNISLKYVNITNYRSLTNNVVVKLETSEKENIVSDSFDTSVNINGEVIVSYVDENGSKLLDDVIISDLVNNDYVTKEEKIDNYILVEIEGDVFGKISLKSKNVKYIYYHNSANYSENLIKTGTLRIDNLDNRIDYNIKYDTIIDNYIGTLEVLLIDYLPYYIDIDNSILGDFIYNEEDNTLVYNFRKDINTYLDGSYNFILDQDLTLKYVDIDIEDRVIKNRVKSLIITDTSSSLEDEFITNISIKSNVTGEYVDVNGNKIASDIVKSNLVGNDYVLEKLDIKGYTLKEIMGNDVGKHTKEDIVVTFIYEKDKIVPPKTGGIKINYLFFLLVLITTCLTSIIFRKKVNSLR